MAVTSMVILMAFDLNLEWNFEFYFEERKFRR